MLLPLFSPNLKDACPRRIILEETLLRLVKAFNEKPKINHTNIDQMLTTCEEYITSIPWEGERQYFFFAAPEKKEQFRNLYPNAEVIFELQKKLMNYRFLPESSSLAKSRWALFRDLLNPSSTSNNLVEGRRLRCNQWLEFRYKGNFEAYRWINNVPDYHLCSYNEAFAQRTLTGIGMQNIFYAAKEQQDKFLTRFDKTQRLQDEKGHIVDTSKKRLLSRRSGMSVYLLTAKGLYVFPDDNESNYQSNIRHSSMMAGRPVLCAGMVRIKEGQIIEINNDSRHYQPTKKNFDSLVDFLKKNKLDIKDISLNFIKFDTQKPQFF
jgi:hypothetical protein